MCMCVLVQFQWSVRQSVVLFTVSTTVEVMYMCIAIKHQVLKKKYSMSHLVNLNSFHLIILMLFTVMTRKSESVVLRHSPINNSD